MTDSLWEIFCTCTGSCVHCVWCVCVCVCVCAPYLCVRMSVCARMVFETSVCVSVKTRPLFCDLLSSELTPTQVVENEDLSPPPVTTPTVPLHNTHTHHTHTHTHTHTQHTHTHTHHISTVHIYSYM